jgi:hypothetical protein
MAASQQTVLHFLNHSACYVEYKDNVFSFHGLKPDKPCIDLQPSQVKEVIFYLKLAQNKLKSLNVSTIEDKVVDSYPIAKEDNVETVLDVQVYNKMGYVWLKKFHVNEGKRRGMPGWVMMNDMDSEILREFFEKNCS